MRPLIWIAVCLAAVLALGFPVIYVSFASGIPPLRSSDEVRSELQRWAENQRMREFSSMTSQVERFEVPALDKMNRYYLALVLTDAGCARYLAEPREPESSAWRRFASHALFGSTGPPGAARCDVTFAEYLATDLGFGDGVRRSIAGFRIRSALSKEDLLRFRVGAARFGPGVIGAPSAARRLLKREFAALTLAEASELYLAEYDFDLIRLCKIAAQVRQFRDQFIDVLGQRGEASAEEVRRARAAPVACLRAP